MFLLCSLCCVLVVRVLVSYEYNCFSAVLVLSFPIVVYVVIANVFLSLFLRLLGSSLRFLALNEKVRLTVWSMNRSQ